MLARALLLLLVCASSLVPSLARAGCCTLVRLDFTEEPQIRACVPDANLGCAEILFEGDLNQGGSVSICSPGASIIYRELEAATNKYRPPVGAVCDGGIEVEL